jgi:hypothetical protein
MHYENQLIHVLTISIQVDLTQVLINIFGMFCTLITNNIVTILIPILNINHVILFSYRSERIENQYSLHFYIYVNFNFLDTLKK